MKAAAKKTPRKKAGRSPEGGQQEPRRNPLAPERIAALLERLAQAYPGAECALHHSNAWELLVATILSAQCTDARVNMVTPALFKKFPTPTDFAHAPLVEIEEQIRSTGFYHNKAKSLNGAARKLTAEYCGQGSANHGRAADPAGRGAQDGQRGAGCRLRQSGREWWWIHTCFGYRDVSNLPRLREPIQVEKDLMKIIPQDHWIAFSHEMIHHGRQVCIARKPRCVDCTLEPLCNSSDKTWSSHD